MKIVEENFKEIAGGITAPASFLAAGINAGVKAGSAKRDIAVIYTPNQTAAAGVFTQNKVAAAPVHWSRALIKGGKARAIVVNSGNANACTGDEGLANAGKMAAWTAEALGIGQEEVLVCSTGVIGIQLPMDVINKGIAEACAALSPQGGHDAALAIMTTDTYAKEVAIETEIDGIMIVIGGMAKGSGMIHPNMATLLGFITTDIKIEPALLQKALAAAADLSFNMITVDGDTSTNDTLLVLADGGSGLEINGEGPRYKAFCRGLNYVCVRLAKMLAADGEGASHFLEIQVTNAKTQHDARLAAKAVAASSLVKAAFFGQDANWGRIICAAGYSGADFDPQLVDIDLQSKAGSEPVMRAGAGLVFDEERAAVILAEKEVKVLIDLHDGKEKATAWGCDLTYDYVKINGDYRT